MPKRNQEQRIKRNETRRNLKKLSRKAIFCMQHLQNIQPDIYKQASGLYDYLNDLYPHKHNLTKTVVYQKAIQKTNVKEQALKHAPGNRNIGQSRELHLKLEIPLMASTTATTSQEQTITTTTDLEKPPCEISPEEIDTIIKDLQQEPDLQSFFNEIEVDASEAIQKSLEEEIDAIIQMEFEAISAELQQLTNSNYELMC